jgi:hypothetical protein
MGQKYCKNYEKMFMSMKYIQHLLWISNQLTSIHHLFLHTCLFGFRNLAAVSVAKIVLC